MGTDRYAVIGRPIAHSASPELHAAFAAQTGQSLRYDRLDAPPDAFVATVEEFFANGGKGLNVTLPYKGEAASRADTLTPRAQRAGAVNTLMVEGGALLGDNTDGAGFMRDLTVNRAFNPAGKRVLLLGAGGAARGIFGPLADARPLELHVANRTKARAEALAATANDAASGGDLERWPPSQYDLIINATAAGHAGSLAPPPAGLLARGCLCYDLSYGPAAAPFIDWARGHGVEVAVDGWGMLVEQAAESFLRWRGVRPRTDSLIAARNSYLHDS